MHLAPNHTPMSRVVGIDPGTKSFDLFGLADDCDEIILDVSVPTSRIGADPESVIDLLKDVCPDLIVGPSGYGVPVKNIRDITPTDIFLMSLVLKDDKKSILGMRRLIEILGKHSLPVCFIPGVIHLPTVPSFRKINKIDMGTPDKLCSCALAIRDQATRRRIDYDQTSLILLEIGFAHTAAIAVDAGAVVDGIGGSSGGIGFLSMGAMDSELAYLLRGFPKEFMTGRGARTLAGSETAIAPEEIARNSDVWLALMDGAVRNVLALTAATMPDEILLSGRLSKIPELRAELTRRLETVAPVRPVEGFPGVKIAKESAQGAALVASGLAHGRYENLVATMRIRDACGTVLDYVPSKYVNLTEFIDAG